MQKKNREKPCLPPFNGYRRRASIPVQVGGVVVGGDAPITIQSMTNTDTANIEATCAQIAELRQAGSELVRITVNHHAAAAAIPAIVERLRAEGAEVPIVGDFHYNGHLLLEKHPDCAEALAKYRINPGNVGSETSHDTNFRKMIEVAIRYDKPIRIGVNWGSLDQNLLARMLDDNQQLDEPLPLATVRRDAIVESALDSARLAEECGMTHDRIILSAKVSEVQELIAVYRQLAGRCDYPLHLGLTEAGADAKGLVATTAALAVLLQDGIGDTIRYSLTPGPDGDRTGEVRGCQYLLQSMGLRSFFPMVTACPGCGRTTSSLFQRLAEEVQGYIHARMPEWRGTNPGVASMKVAVMGCIVNGPGESKHADIGISLPGDLEEPRAMVFADGEQVQTLSGDGITEEFKKMLEDYVARRFGTPE